MRSIFTNIILKSLVIALLFLCSLHVSLGTAANLDLNAQLQKANTEYSKAEYLQAIQTYNSIIETSGYSANLLYNLANSYAQIGQTGKAIALYHRAHNLEPSDPDILGNYEAVSKKAGLFDEESSLFEKIINTFTFDQWSKFTLFLFALFSALCTAYTFVQKKKTIFQVSCIGLIFLTMIIGSAAVSRYKTYKSSIVITPNNPLLVSPFNSSAAEGSIQEGKVITVKKEYGDFYLIEDGSHRTGWLPKNSVEHIMP